MSLTAAMIKSAAVFLAGVFFHHASAAAQSAAGRGLDAPVEIRPASKHTLLPAKAEAERLRGLQAQYAPVELQADISSLPQNEKQALAKMIQAAQIMDALFLRQAWADNEKMLDELKADASPLGQARLRYFLTNKGPWDRIDHNKPFIPGVGEKPSEANFYPQGATKEEVNRWIESLPPAEKARATGFFTTIRRASDAAGEVVLPARGTERIQRARSTTSLAVPGGYARQVSPLGAAGEAVLPAAGRGRTSLPAAPGEYPPPGARGAERIPPGGKFKIVPYNEEYRGELRQAATLLKEAANLTQQPTLKTFLDKRAEAFLSDEYYDSDVAWMELDASIEPTIGPYENYEDGWFNYKAAFEAFITVLDVPGTKDLQKFSAQLQSIEDVLPIDPSRRNPKLGAMSPIRVVNQIYASGDAARGVATAAFNLPNDEKVTAEKGSKRTMLKNVQEAKFKMVLLPISKIALAPADQKNVDFDAFFTHILMHELMHGLGPHDIILANGEKTTARKALQDLSSAFEEAKADISGLWALQRLIDKGILDKTLERTMYDTFLASSFRTIRFGVAEAHGKGMALQLNYLIDGGAVTVAEDGTFAVNRDRIKQVVQSLTHDIMTIQARGDYEAAGRMLRALGVVRPEVQAVIDRLKDVPVDIDPKHAAAEALLKQTALQK